MIRGFMFDAIIKLWKDGKSKKAISRAINHDIKTVRKVIKSYQQSATAVSYKQRITLVNNYQQDIQKLLENDISSIRIFEIIKQNGYQGSYSSLTDFTRKLKNTHKICVRFHTPPGKEAQVDFGEVGKLYNPAGKLAKTYIFNMRLSFSRLDYYEIVFTQKVETFIQCHINAFEYFGAVPLDIKIDNLKSAIIEASFYEPVYQNLYASLADYYGFNIVPCRVRKPQEKGKVESAIKYVQNNFFAGRTFADYKIMTIELRDWLNNYCNQRIHGTTKEKPYDLFKKEEKQELKALPEKRFAFGHMFIRKVHCDCHITIDHNYYSVPYEYVGKIVEIEVSESLVKIYEGGKQIALHSKIAGKGQFSTTVSHYPKYKYFANDSEEYLSKSELDMSQIGCYTKALFAVIVAENPHNWYRIVSGILNLRKTYSDQVIELSCKRALYFSITQYSKIKSICQSGCYKLELPKAVLN